jgi:hypothetical protein
VHIHSVTNRNRFIGNEICANNLAGTLIAHWSTEIMTTDCPDGYCRQKIQAIDNAIGFTKNEWATLLDGKDSLNDVSKALQFCEAFKLEARVSITSEGLRVQFRHEILKLNNP